MLDTRNLLTEVLSQEKLVCYDVGARGGVESHWESFTPWMEIHAFEPEPESHRPHTNYEMHWHACALGGKTARHNLYVLNRASGSSFYPPNEEIFSEANVTSYYGLNKVVEVDTYGLSDFAEKFDAPLPNLIKLDTQGSELDIMSSLSDEDWNSMICIQTEVEFEEIYLGQPLFSQVDDFIRSRGFRLFDLRTHRNYLARNNQRAYHLRETLGFSAGRNDLSAKLYAGDALYFRDFRNGFPATKGEWAKLTLSLLVYRYYDYAIAVTEDAVVKGIISEADAKETVAMIVDYAPSPRIHERTHSRFGNWLRGVLERVGIVNRHHQAFWMKRQWPDQ